MSRSRSFAVCAAWAACVGALACTVEPTPATTAGAAPSPAGATPSATALEIATDEALPAEAAASASPWPLPDEVLTPWQAALILMDPHALTAEQRRQRAYARRKAIMLNPDSPTAKVLEDLAKAAAAGEIDPKASGEVVFSVGGTPAKGAPPAGWRPPATEEP